MTFKLNNQFEILTPSGWKNFNGIQKLVKNKLYIIFLKNGYFLKCSIDHNIKRSNGNFENVQNLIIGDKILCKNNEISEIINIEIVNKKTKFYDPINVDGLEYLSNGIISHNCEFLGSSNTLIKADKLKELVEYDPIEIYNDLKIYEPPQQDSEYVLCVDVSEGIGLDFSVISVIDITNYPYKQVAVYRSNLISPILFPEVILNLATQYNEGIVLIEVNNIGSSVAKDLYLDLQYDNILMTRTNGRGGQQISVGFAKNVSYGLKMTPATKRIGCANLKTLIENDKLIVNDGDTILELLNFVQIKNSYEADAGMSDDIVMTLVIFSWLVNQQFFKDTTTHELRKKLLQERQERHEENLVPFMYDDGLEYAEQHYDSIGDI